MDKLEEILEYISKNQGTTEYKIAKYMAENHVCARNTTHNTIYNVLIPLGKVIDRKKGNSFHKLYINNENEFIKLSSDIDRLCKAIERVNSFVHADLLKKDRLVRGMVELAQRVLYNRITQLSWKIRANIKSSDDREMLYPHLVNVLETSSKLNRKTSDSFFEDLETMTGELRIPNKRQVRDKETLALFKGIIETTNHFTSNLA